MAYYVYILFTKSLNKFYVGYTEDIVTRIDQHNQSFYDASFTKQANDWEVFHLLECNSKTQAIKVEAHIKRMKSKTYLSNLKSYPEIGKKLLEKY